jgi:hypothetical protein
MLMDPHMALRFAKERQAQLRHEAQSDRLADQQLRQRTAPLLLRLSDLLVLSGLWLRSHAEHQPSAAAVPAGRWHAIPLVMLRLIEEQTTGHDVGAFCERLWPVYTLGMSRIAQISGYAIVPATWLVFDGVQQLS